MANALLLYTLGTSRLCSCGSIFGLKSVEFMEEPLIYCRDLYKLQCTFVVQYTGAFSTAVYSCAPPVQYGILQAVSLMLIR